MNGIRLVNASLCFVGACLFAAALIYFQSFPDDFKDRTRDIAIAEVSERFDETIMRFQQQDRVNALTQFATQLSEELKAEIENRRHALEHRLDEFIANALAATCRLDCDKQEQAQQLVREFLERDIAFLTAGHDRILGFIENEYDKVLEELRYEFTIFSASNALLFSFAFALLLFKGRASVHLVPASTALIIATVIAILLYVFGQDWLKTIVFGSYWGWGYLGFSSVIALSLMDVAFNRARITSFALNAFFSAIGSAFSVLPC